ncbi:PREDICTED: uncharacterized protein LOC107353815 [Acropora digitifera]|uniref:uncharacterized protein LOC107353815 n=1 Tax=Acropora digitifera TaxID=70779 RepID=UPI00077AEFC2|nr:PREDICTED: uncharacterized protein LOC107353815 [Acropora digitifera]
MDIDTTHINMTMALLLMSRPSGVRMLRNEQQPMLELDLEHPLYHVTYMVASVHLNLDSDPLNGYQLSANVVTRSQTKVSRFIQEFARAHVEYHNRLNDECDIDESEEYYRSVHQANGPLGCEISSWIITCNRSRFETPLAAATREEIDDVTPDDSISNVGSRARSRHSRRSKSSSGRSKGSAASSVQSARAKAAAKKAMLEVEARKLENWQALKKEELALEMKKKGLELETEIAKAAAEELAYAQVENDAREPLSDFEKPCVKEPREFVTDAAQNINFRREELEVPAKSERNTAEPQSSPVAREFPRLVANDVAPTNYNTPAARFAQIPTAKVKSECYEPTQNATFGDVAVRQLLDAQYFQNQQLQALIQRQQESTLALTLPQPNVPVFSGNPIEYWTFIRAFENLIDRKTTSESARLYYLVQYTSGDVQELVKSCLSIGDDSGYQTARKLLQKAYGSSYKIANAYVKKLTSGPAIKAEDGEGLRKLSIALTGCKNTLTEIGYLNKLENPDTLRTIVQRLPFGLRQRWRDVADNITETQNREITITDLSDFVNAKARAATHAIFGDLSSHAPLSQGGSGVRRRPQSPTKSSFATNVGVNPNRTGDEEQKTQANRKCPLCKSNHWLSQCNNFKEKSLAARWQFVTSRGLCANCLVAGHLANSCPKKGFCRVTVCNGKHSREIADEEVKATFATDAVQAPARSIDLEELFKTFSSWMKLKRFVAWILRFKKNLRDPTAGGMEKERSASKKKIQPINVEELRQAEKAIIEVVQSKAFKEELLSLKGPPKELKRSSSILRLDPILVDDIICVGGRLQKSSIRARAKHPAILPKNHHISDLIVRHHHQISGHSGIEHTLSLVRESYWIIKARITLRRVLASCFDCRKRQAPVGRQKMASLPEDRVNSSEPPFSRVGVDCFGPLNVRRGRSVVKRYGVLFTCLSIRAIHIEVAHTLDANSFINALRRFIARRGQPIQMRSDNGGNFVRGEKELREAVRNWNQDKIHNFLLAKNVKWSFNPPTGSHHGGVWERCIRTVRKVMGALVKEQPLDDEGLLTLVCEVEAIVNGRPITKVSDDPRDPEALTPNHLLLLRAGPSLPPGYFEKSDNYSRRRWRQVQYLADLFWKRWTREYLPSLQERQKWEKASRNFAVGDVVLVLDESLPRCSWPLGRVIEVFPNRSDGLVRSVRLKTTSSVLVRPVNKLVLLEAS